LTCPIKNSQIPPEIEDEGYTVLCKFYVPEDTILERSRQDKVHYDIWAQQGYLNATPGNVIDYEFIEKDVKKACEIFNVIEIGFDPWGATDLANRLIKEFGDNFMIEMRQGAHTLSEPAKDILVKTMEGKINHGNHPVLRWCTDNLVMVLDANENVRPAKDKATDRIDGFVALIMAWGRAIFGEKEIDLEDLKTVG